MKAIINGITFEGSVDEIRQIIRLTPDKYATEQPVVKYERKHKKHQFLKQCPECPRTLMGNMALGKHRARYHGYISPNRKRWHGFKSEPLVDKSNFTE